MMINNSLFKYFFITLFVFVQYEISCQELSRQEIQFNTTTNVFCSTKNNQWNWLEGNNKSIIVHGDLITSAIKINDFEELIIKYFKLSAGILKLNELKKKCISKFGDEYIFAQPGSRFFDSWYVFGDEGGVLFDGIFRANLKIKDKIRPIYSIVKIFSPLNINEKYLEISDIIKTEYYKNNQYCKYWEIDSCN